MRSVMDLQFYSNLLKDNPTKNLNSKGGVPKKDNIPTLKENKSHHGQPNTVPTR